MNYGNYGTVIIKVVFLIGFWIQFGKLIQDTVSSKELYTEMMKVNGTRGPFPLGISICVNQPAMNETALQVKHRKIAKRCPEYISSVVKVSSCS